MLLCVKTYVPVRTLHCFLLPVRSKTSKDKKISIISKEYDMSFVHQVYFTFGALVGTIGTMLFITNKIIKQREQEKKECKLPTLFLNVYLLNKKDVVKRSVTKKVNHGIFGIRRKIASRLANVALSDESFSRKVATNMSKELPGKLKEKNISAAARVAYVHKTYFVVEIQIMNVDVVSLIDAKLDEKKKSMFHTALEMMGKIGLRESVESCVESELTKVIQQRLVVKMGNEMMEKMKKDGGLETHVEVKSAKDQASYFYEALSCIDEKKK